MQVEVVEVLVMGRLRRAARRARRRLRPRRGSFRRAASSGGRRAGRLSRRAAGLAAGRLRPAPRAVHCNAAAPLVAAAALRRPRSTSVRSFAASLCARFESLLRRAPRDECFKSLLSALFAPDLVLAVVSWQKLSLEKQVVQPALSTQPNPCRTQRKKTRTVRGVQHRAIFLKHTTDGC